MNEIIQWRRAGKAYLTEVDHVTVAVSVHPAGGWQWCTNRDNGPSGYDPGLADAKEHAVQFTRLWLSERELEVSLQALKEENAMLRDEVEHLQQDAVIARSVETSLTVEVEHLRGERAAVVAWLRAEAREPGASPDEKNLLSSITRDIERGEHRREEEA